MPIDNLDSQLRRGVLEYCVLGLLEEREHYGHELVQRLKQTGVPIIYFGTDTATLLPDMQQTGADVIGLDWRIPLDEGWARLGCRGAVQGNLDPVALFAPWPELRSRIEDVLRRAAGRAGHIFNLGHGILPETPVENVKALVEFVHEHSARELAHGGSVSQ